MRIVNTSFRLRQSSFKLGNSFVSTLATGEVFRIYNSDSLFDDAITYTKTDGTEGTVSVQPLQTSYFLAVSGSIPDTPVTGSLNNLVVINLLATSSVERFISFQEVVISGSGAGTWTKPIGVDQVIVECWGGGGAGGGATVTDTTGGGGGGGQYSRKLIIYSLPQSSISYSVGGSTAGGTGVGATGSSTTWETNVVIAVGGTGGDILGLIDSPAPGGIGNRSGSVGDVIYFGSDGQVGSFTFPDGVAFGGDGGFGAGSAGGLISLSNTKEYGGEGGIAAAVSSGNGGAGSVYGGGGGGAVKLGGANRSGGAGAQGLIRIIYRLTEKALLQVSADPQNTLSYPGSGSSWFDTSPNNFTGSLFNTPTYSATSPANFTFDAASNEYALFPYSGSATDSFTIAAWVKIATTGAKTFVTRGRDFSGNGWSLQLSLDANTLPSFGVVTTSPTTVSTITSVLNPINTDTWYFLAGVWDPVNDTQTIYVNAADGEDNATDINTGSNLRTSTDGISIASISTVSYSSVSVGNVRVYNRAFSLTQLLELFENDKSRYGI